MIEPNINKQANASYHDFSGLNELRKAAKDDPEAATLEVAKQFESIFIQMMLKSMRAALPDGGLFDSNQMDTFQEMFDQQLGVSMANEKGLGLADVIARQLSPPAKTPSASVAAASYAEQNILKPAVFLPINSDGQQ